jgi:hypothetical protein
VNEPQVATESNNEPKVAMATSNQVDTNSHGAVNQPNGIDKVVMDAFKHFDNSMEKVQL